MSLVERFIKSRILPFGLVLLGAVKPEIDGRVTRQQRLRRPLLRSDERKGHCRGNSDEKNQSGSQENALTTHATPVGSVALLSTARRKAKRPAARGIAIRLPRRTLGPQ